MLLLVWCLGVTAQVSVVTQDFIGGTVEEKSQTERGDDGYVIVTLTVTPESGYYISKSDIKVMATIPVEGDTRAAEGIRIGDPLTLEGDDPEDLSQPRDYTVKVGQPFGIYVMEASFKTDMDFIDGGIYRIGHVLDETHWYLWPSVTTDSEGNPYLTTFNGVSAPALDYAVRGVSYEAFGEQYSQWQVSKVEKDGQTCYRLKNVALQQYVVWSDIAGEKAVHLEKKPADDDHTLFRFDGKFPHVLITPVGAAEGTTLNSKAGDKPFLSASGAANAGAGYPEGEPDANGERGLMQILPDEPVWTFEELGVAINVTFDKISEEGSEQAAVFTPQEDLALPEGLSAYLITGIDLLRGMVLVEEVDYLPTGVPTLLIAESSENVFAISPKDPETPEISEEVISANLLRIGSPEVQPTPFEDYVFKNGRFVMVGGGTLATGRIFLDLNQEQASRTRGVLSVGGTSGTTDIHRVENEGSVVRTGWYTLDGRKLDSVPSRKGIYIRNGRKEVVK